MSKVSSKAPRNLAWQRANRKEAAVAKQKLGPSQKARKSGLQKSKPLSKPRRKMQKIKHESAADYFARRKMEERKVAGVQTGRFADTATYLIEVDREPTVVEEAEELKQRLRTKEEGGHLLKMLDAAIRAGALESDAAVLERGRTFWNRYARNPLPDYSLDEVSESEEQELQRKRLEQYDRAVAKARALFREKNTEYKDAISANGVLGAVVEMAGIAQRLHQVLVHPAVTCVEELEGAETRLLPRAKRNSIVTDKSLDAINFGIISLMMMEEGNWTGN